MTLENDFFINSFKKNKYNNLSEFFINKKSNKPLYNPYGKTNISDVKIQAYDFLEPKIINISQFERINQLRWFYKKKKYLFIGNEILNKINKTNYNYKTIEDIFNDNNIISDNINNELELIIELKKLKMYYFFEKSLFIN